PGLRVVDVLVGGDDVEIPDQGHRVPDVDQRLCMPAQPRHPLELVVELRAGLRIAIGQVEAPHDDAMHRSFQVTALLVLRIARQSAPAFHRHRVAGEQRDAIPGTLPVPDRAIAGRFDIRDRERLVHRLEFLQRDDVRLFLLQPSQQVRQARTDAVDVERGELQRGGAAGHHSSGRPKGLKKAAPAAMPRSVSAARRWRSMSRMRASGSRMSACDAPRRSSAAAPITIADSKVSRTCRSTPALTRSTLWRRSLARATTGTSGKAPSSGRTLRVALSGLSTHTSTTRAWPAPAARRMSRRVPSP